ncbi:MarR family transcriptional regulator [Actinoallomurus purpureus]|uniref:MarR family winged helix-turn-helix transcriptional regulator n=1 Tax=Actinoallomurus purpureus TaxID=478114 RepID=UPI002093CDF6|nr:MarR family transcriptional regulator [Actinoallomurus purpureus]MCO6010933.1 MarR family transcriptional regulator [Actinoallomurus purpureus]
MNMPTSQTRSRAGLAAALRVSVSRLSRRMRAQAGQSLSVTQLAALGALSRHAVMTPGELAEHEKVQPPSMTRVIAALEERGLLTRSPHPTDRRQVILSVTEEGEKLLKEERRRKEAWLAQRLAELTPEEREILRQAAPILERLSKV